MIPKKIHYCWFGGKPLTKLAEECIASWRLHYPDYEIVEWNETNFDVSQCEYSKKAYELKKMAFVSDYARFKIIRDYGGIYFDVDVKALNRMPDNILQHPFMGMEHKNKHFEVNPGLGFGGTEDLPFLNEIIGVYEKASFLDDSDSNIKTIVDYTTELLVKYGFDINKNSIQQIRDILIYPTDYFSPMDMADNSIKITNNTYSIHLYSGSWADPTTQKGLNLRRKYVKRFGTRLGNALYKIPYFFIYAKDKGIKHAIKKVFGKNK